MRFDKVPEINESMEMVLTFFEENRDEWFSRSQLVQKMNQPRTTIFESIKKLQILGIANFEEKMVKRKNKKKNIVGRPKVFWRLIENE